MRRPAMALPATFRLSGAIWCWVSALWHMLMATVREPYRPEQHYMRGPGPKSRERQDGKRDAQKYCPKCATVMVLERVAPKFGPLPEQRTYKCLQCGCEVEEDIDPQIGRRADRTSE